MFRMSIRTILLSAGLSLAAASPASAQNGVSPWEPWIGCWDLVPRDNFADNSSRVCVLPTATPAAVDLVSVVGDSVTSRRRLDAAGQSRAVSQGECKGTEQINAARGRVYLRTLLTCGEEQRLVNSVMAMSSAGEWLDVRGVAFGSNVGVRVSRFRPTPASVKLPGVVVAALRDRPNSGSAARIAASGLLQLSDVVDASRYLEVGVLQTWLAERGQGFRLSGQQLIALEESGVAPSVIDIMVALSYPSVFALDRTRLGDPPPNVAGDFRGGDVYVDDEYYDDYGYGGYDPYGYGYGRGYGWYPGRQPVVVVERPAKNDEEHGQAVKGRGYVSGRDNTTRTATSGDESRGRSGASGSGGSSDKGTNTGRKAKPKPQQ